MCESCLLYVLSTVRTIGPHPSTLLEAPPNLFLFAFYIANIHCEFALGYMFFTYPLTDVPKATRSSECYASFLLAPAEG